jgi:hypothetical protein
MTNWPLTIIWYSAVEGNEPKGKSILTWEAKAIKRIKHLRAVCREMTIDRNPFKIPRWL